MPRISVTLSANAGVAISAGAKHIWVDVLHRQKLPGFSTLTKPLLEKMECSGLFDHPDHICYTHCHPDHYCREWTDDAMKKWPTARLHLPGCPRQYQEDDLEISFFNLPHEGAQYAQTEHQGILIKLGECNILVAGDCATASEELSAFIQGKHIHVAILPFPWLTLKKGRDFLQTYLPEAVLVMCHLPFAEDDEMLYRIAANRALQYMPRRDIRLLLDPMQTEYIEI